MAEELGSHHRDTLKRLFAHPASGNIEWREVKSLLESIGAASEGPNGALRVTLGGETEVLRRPHGKDLDAPRKRGNRPQRRLMTIAALRNRVARPERTNRWSRTKGSSFRM
jgi:hypothetical protein